MHYFNPRSPHGERQRFAQCLKKPKEFQSTLPARGATEQRLRAHRPRRISIHAPRTGSDVWAGAASSSPGSFQSTLPARGATLLSGRIALLDLISIHAPRTGSDTISIVPSLFDLISIHAPRTGSDVGLINLRSNQFISIHAPRTGSDEARRSGALR